MATPAQVQAFDFKDIRLIPGQCQVRSRSEVDTSIELGERKFKLPVVPANMSTILDRDTAIWLAQRGYFYVMHRFDNDPVDLTRDFHEAGVFASISLGVQKADFLAVQRFVDAGLQPEYITIDIAHGDSPVVFELVSLIRRELPQSFIIAGNVATPGATQRLEHAGAHAIKVGIGPGCFTGDMLVKTDEGLVKMEDMQPGMKVLTHTGESKNVKHKMTFDFHEEVIEINGITCTPDHRFYVCNVDDLAKINETNYLEFCYWVEASQLDENLHRLVKIEDD